MILSWKRGTLVKMKQKTSPTQKTLNLWAVVLIIWAVYRAQFKTELPIWFDEFIAKPLVFILPVFWYIKKVEKKAILPAVGFAKMKMNDALAVIVLTVGYLLFISFLRNFAQMKTSIFTPQTLIVIALSFATAFSEQILSSGFVLKRLYDDSKNALTSSFFASILFFFIHVPILFTNEHLVGYTLLWVMLTDLLLSISIAFIFLSWKNLWLPILIHAFYNMSIYFLMQ